MARRQTNFGYDNSRGRRGYGADHGISLPAPRPQSEYDWNESSEDEVVECPLCLEPMDETDQTFFPCVCQYQMCLYCFNRIKDKNDHLKDTCPACRTKYNTESYRYITPDEAAENRRKNHTKRDNELDQQQLAQITAMSDARAKAMEAQAKRCGACQVEGPPIDPDPSYSEPSVTVTEENTRAPPRNNSWATLAAGGSQSSASSDQGVWGRGGKQASTDPWGGAWPALDDGANDVPGMDDWEQLAQEMVRETADVSRLGQPQAEQESRESKALDAEIMRIREEIEGVTRSVASTREELTKQDVLYDHYQEKCADLRLQQQNWDAGIIDLLSKWQGWTDVTERSEAAHFEEESMLMAQLITHQQSMAEALSNLNDTSPPVGTTDSSWSSEAAVGGRQPLYKPNNSLSSGTTGSGWGSSAVIQPSGSGIRPLGSTIISGSRLFGSDDSKPSAWGPAPAPSQTQDAGHSAWGAQPSRNPGSTNAWGNVGTNGRANNSGLQDTQPSVWGGSNSMW